MFIVMFSSMFVSCVTSHYVEQKDGFYSLDVDYKFNDVYKVATEVINGGLILNRYGKVYYLDSSKLTHKDGVDKVEIKGVNQYDNDDYLWFIITKVSDNVTDISIRYGDFGNSTKVKEIISKMKTELAKK